MRLYASRLSCYPKLKTSQVTGSLWRSARFPLSIWISTELLANSSRSVRSCPGLRILTDRAFRRTISVTPFTAWGRRDQMSSVRVTRLIAAEERPSEAPESQATAEWVVSSNAARSSSSCNGALLVR